MRGISREPARALRLLVVRRPCSVGAPDPDRSRGAADRVIPFSSYSDSRRPIACASNQPGSGTATRPTANAGTSPISALP